MSGSKNITLSNIWKMTLQYNFSYALGQREHWQYSTQERLFRHNLIKIFSQDNANNITFKQTHQINNMLIILLTTRRTYLIIGILYIICDIIHTFIPNPSLLFLYQVLTVPVLCTPISKRVMFIPHKSILYQPQKNMIM